MPPHIKRTAAVVSDRGRRPDAQLQKAAAFCLVGHAPDHVADGNTRFLRIADTTENGTGAVAAFVGPGAALTACAGCGSGDNGAGSAG